MKAGAAEKAGFLSSPGLVGLGPRAGVLGGAATDRAASPLAPGSPRMTSPRHLQYRELNGMLDPDMILQPVRWMTIPSSLNEVKIRQEEAAAQKREQLEMYLSLLFRCWAPGDVLLSNWRCTFIHIMNASPVVLASILYCSVLLCSFQFSLPFALETEQQLPELARCSVSQSLAIRNNVLVRGAML